MAMIQDGVLALLARGPSHGYALWQTLRSWSADPDSVQGGSVYAALRRLEKAGALREVVVDAAPLSTRDRPMRIDFALTDDGRARYQRWREEPPSSVEDLRLRLALVAPTDDLQSLSLWVKDELAATQLRLGAISSEHRGAVQADSWEAAARLALSRLTFREVSARAQWLAEVHSQLQTLRRMAESERCAR